MLAKWRLYILLFQIALTDVFVHPMDQNQRGDGSKFTLILNIQLAKITGSNFITGKI